MSQVKNWNEFNQINENVERSNKWLYKIKFKDELSEKTDKEEIAKLSKRMAHEVERIKNNLERNNRVEDEEKEYFLTELEDILNNFKFLAELSNGGIKEEDWDDFGFDGDFTDLFNQYLAMLYDLGDRRINMKNNKSYKFLWIH